MADPRAAALAANTFATHATPSAVSTTANVSPLAPAPRRSPCAQRAGKAEASTILAVDTSQSYGNYKKKKG